MLRGEGSDPRPAGDRLDGEPGRLLGLPNSGKLGVLGRGAPLGSSTRPEKTVSVTTLGDGQAYGQ